MGFMSLMYLICALRTNIVFVTIFFGLFMCFVLLTGSYWQIAMGQFAVAAKLQIASGAFAFLACLAGWYVQWCFIETSNELMHCGIGGYSLHRCSLPSTFPIRSPLATSAISFEVELRERRIKNDFRRRVAKDGWASWVRRARIILTNSVIIGEIPSWSGVVAGKGSWHLDVYRKSNIVSSH